MVTGLIYAAIVVLWAAYLVPLALRRYDEASRDRSVDTFSSRMRILRRGGSGADGESDDPAGTRDEAVSDEVTEPENPKPERPHTDPTPVPQSQQRESTRIAVRRRRRTLLTLLFATSVVAGLATAAIVPWWSVAIPGGLVVAWLVACRIQVLGEMSEPAPVAMGDEPDDEPTIVLSAQPEQFRSALGEDSQPERKNVMLEEPFDEAHLEEQVSVAVPYSTSDGGSLWDPVPVTLPTYVDKPRAERTIRTIDFNGSDVWTSGHVDGEQTEIPGDRDDHAEEPRRAVGD